MPSRPGLRAPHNRFVCYASHRRCLDRPTKGAASMAVQYAVGDVLGNYNLLAKVGEGSMGTVYKASHWRTHDVVAIKVMPSNIARKPSLLKRFEQEFRLASKVN